MWARAALAALIGLIALGASAANAIVPNAGLASNQETKQGLPPSLECVPIFDPSENIDGHAAVSELLDFGFRKLSLGWQHIVNRGAGANDDLPSGWFGSQGQFFHQRKFGQLDTRFGCCFISWGLAIVPYFYVETGFAHQVFNSNLGNIYVGAQLPFLSYSHLANRKNTNGDQAAGDHYEKKIKNRKVDIRNFDVTYIFLRPFFFLLIGMACTILGYLVTASRCEKFQRNERRRFIADAVGLLLGISGPLIAICGFWPWI